MHAILAVEKPQDVDEILSGQNWNALLETLKDIAQTSQGIQTLAPNVLQIPLENGLHPLVKCGEVCRGRKISYKTLFFEDEPQWITTTRNEE